jgi:flagellar basal-body rod modification protein FlgD
MASSVNSLLGTSTSSTSGASSTSSSGLGGSTPSEGVFLQLLVAQLQNQDPLNPTDSTTFVTQLAQFSELEQVIGIRSDIETAMGSGASSGSSPTSQTSGADSTGTQTTTHQTTNAATQS